MEKDKATGKQICLVCKKKTTPIPIIGKFQLPPSSDPKIVSKIIFDFGEEPIEFPIMGKPMIEAKLFMCQHCGNIAVLRE